MTDAKNFYDRWPTMTPEEKRNTVESLVIQIVVYENDLKIELAYLPTIEEMAKRGSKGVLWPALRGEKEWEKRGPKHRATKGHSIRFREFEGTM